MTKDLLIDTLISFCSPIPPISHGQKIIKHNNREISKTWFQNNNTDDVNTVITFIENLPNQLEVFINPNTSNLKIIAEKLDNSDLSFESFQKAFNDSKEYYKTNFLLVLRKLKLDKVYNNTTNSKTYKTFLKGIKSSGLTGQQLRTKIEMLNKLWENVYSFIYNTAQKIIDFSNNKLVKLVRKFLSFLNSFLSSLISAVGAFIPGVDSMKEIKDLIEGYLDLGESMV